jgi:outer membrane protein assembly factor BamD
MSLRNVICYAIMALAPTALVAQGVPQPDKALYYAGVGDVQNGRFERARLTLQTLINTYKASEMLAPAKLAIADSWYREGGTNGFDQAEKECKEIVAQFPDTPSSSEAQQLMRKIQDARAAKQQAP